MFHLARLISLRNLTRSRRLCSPGGQISTLLILIMVVLIIFTLATANMGQVAMGSTTVANASDAASLNLGSQLSTKANVLWHSLGKRTSKCKRGGFLAILLSIVFAVIALTNPAIGAALGHGAVMIGATAGAIGGAIGGAIIYGNLKGAFIGAVQGFQIGASIGYAFQAFGARVAQAPVKPGQTLDVGTKIKNIGTDPTSITGGQGMVQGMAVMPGEVATITPAMGSMIAGSGLVSLTPAISAAGAALGMGLSAGATMYNAIIMDKLDSAAMAAAVKALNGLPDYTRIQQSVIFDGLTRSIDDPTMIPDTNDLDGDGITDEKVPNFMQWWEDRMDRLRKDPKMVDVQQKVSAFLTGPLTTIRSQLAALYARGGLVSRQEVEGSDGSVVALARAAKTVETFELWEPGPNKAQLDAWYKQLDASDCDDDEAGSECPPPPGIWDRVDEFNEDARDEVAAINELLAKDSRQQVLANWGVWTGLFYDPDDPDGDVYSKMMTELKDWKQEIMTAKNGLPECECPPAFQPPIIVFFEARPASIDAGETTELYWDTIWQFYGISCSITGGSWVNKPVGTRNRLSPGEPTEALTQDTDYTLTCSNVGGSDSRTIRVSVTPSVVPPPPPPPSGDDPWLILTINGKDKDTITEGDTALLFWQSGNTDECRLLELKGRSPGIGRLVNTSGAEQKIPSYGVWSYTMTCQNTQVTPIKSVQKKVTLTVLSASTRAPTGLLPLAGLWLSDEAFAAGGVSCDAPGAVQQPIDVPCKISTRPSPPYYPPVPPTTDYNPYATTDQNIGPTDDEFNQTLAAIDKAIGQLQAFHDAAKAFVDQLPDRIDGPNPGVYEWNDTRGHHTVEVSVGLFKLPRLKKTSHGWLVKKKCIKLTDYKDDGRNAWVRIKREDPKDKQMGMWTWNFVSDPNKQVFITEKTSRVSYSFDRVGVTSTSKR